MSTQTMSTCTTSCQDNIQVERQPGQDLTGAISYQDNILLGKCPARTTSKLKMSVGGGEGGGSMRQQDTPSPPQAKFLVSKFFPAWTTPPPPPTSMQLCLWRKGTRKNVMHNAKEIFTFNRKDSESHLTAPPASVDISFPKVSISSNVAQSTQRVNRRRVSALDNATTQLIQARFVRLPAW